jgi:hypothetical protein
MEGVRVLDDFSIVAEVGAGRALVKSTVVQVADGNGLQIDCDRDGGNDVFVNGIEIEDADSEPPTVTVTYPNDGTEVSGTVTVSGTATDNLELVSVEVEVDGGPLTMATGTTSWTYSLATADLADGSHVLTVLATDIGGSTATDSVALVVNNTDPKLSISLLAPNGGEVWTAGTTQHLRWTTEHIDDVSMAYSTDGGECWQTLVGTLSATTPEWGSFPWLVPNEPSTRCLVRIQGYFGQTPTVSAGFFEIRASPTPADSGGAGLVGNCSALRACPWGMLLLFMLGRSRRNRRTV